VREIQLEKENTSGEHPTWTGSQSRRKLIEGISVMEVENPSRGY